MSFHKSVLLFLLLPLLLGISGCGHSTSVNSTTLDSLSVVIDGAVPHRESPDSKAQNVVPVLPELLDLGTQPDGSDTEAALAWAATRCVEQHIRTVYCNEFGDFETGTVLSLTSGEASDTALAEPVKNLTFFAEASRYLQQNINRYDLQYKLSVTHTAVTEDRADVFLVSTVSFRYEPGGHPALGSDRYLVEFGRYGDAWYITNVVAEPIVTQGLRADTFDPHVPPYNVTETEIDYLLTESQLVEFDPSIIWRYAGDDPTFSPAPWPVTLAIPEAWAGQVTVLSTHPADASLTILLCANRLMDAYVTELGLPDYCSYYDYCVALYGVPSYDDRFLEDVAAETALEIGRDCSHTFYVKTIQSRSPDSQEATVAQPLIDALGVDGYQGLWKPFAYTLDEAAQLFQIG